MAAIPTLPAQLNNANIDQFVSDFNAYYHMNPQNIMGDMYYGLEDVNSPFYIGNRVTMYSGVIRKEILPTLDSTHIIQKANSAEFNAKGENILGGRALEPMGWKIDTKIDWQKTYREYVQMWETAERNRVPHESNIVPDLNTYFMMNIMKQAGYDIRQAIFQGSYSSSATAYGHLQWLNGFNKIIKDEITGSVITPYPISATSSANVLTEIKKLYSYLGEGWKRSPNAIILVASDVYELLTDTASFGSTAQQLFISQPNRTQIAANILAYPLPYAPNVKVIHEPYLPEGGMLATVKENLVFGYDSTDIASSLRFQLIDRQIKVLGDGSACVQIRRVASTEKGNPIVVNEAMDY